MNPNYNPIDPQAGSLNTYNTGANVVNDNYNPLQPMVNPTLPNVGAGPLGAGPLDAQPQLGSLSGL